MGKTPNRRSRDLRKSKTPRYRSIRKKPKITYHSHSRRSYLHPRLRSQSAIIPQNTQFTRSLSLNRRRHISLPSHNGSISTPIRIIPDLEELVAEYNIIAQDTIPTITDLAATLNNRVHFIFLFAGNAYVEQCFVSKIREIGLHIASISFVDLHYTNAEKNAILTGFPEVECYFYGLDQLDTLIIHPNSICMGFRPQVNYNTSSQIDDFIRKYYHTNPIPIYLIRMHKMIVIVDNGEKIQPAIRRLYKNDHNEVVTSASGS